MTFEVLVATMNQIDHSLLERMKINSDAIVCNQNAHETAYTTFQYNGYTIRWYDFEEQGVGLNRNNALMRSTADICLLADDDEVLVEGYRDIVLRAFNDTPSADVLLFNIYDNSNSGRVIISKKRRIGKLECGRFGAVRISFRRIPVLKNRISFSLLFGGGAMFSAGEDTQFLSDCWSKGLRIYAVESYILKLNEDDKSSWFTGYNDKFFRDVGISCWVSFKSLAWFILAVQLIRHRKQYLNCTTYYNAFKWGCEGIKVFRKMR